MENHLDFIVIKAEPKFRADSFVLDEADCSAAPVETGIVPVTLSLYACDKRDTAARRAWDNFGVVTEMVPLGLLSGCLLLPQAYEDADALIVRTRTRCNAALLHDTIEDTETTDRDITRLFGERVTQLVEGVTKITRIEVESLSDEQAATIRKMFVAMNQDIRVVVIKLADRLHNMRTLSSLREDRRIVKSRETL